MNLVSLKAKIGELVKKLKNLRIWLEARIE